MPFKYRSMEERLVANSRKSEEHSYKGDPCWEWTGQRKKNRNGVFYPYITVRVKRGPRKGKTRIVAAHRMSLKVFKGRRMSPRMVGAHLCNYTLCINPEHLVGGSQSANVRYAVRSGRLTPPNSKAKR